MRFIMKRTAATLVLLFIATSPTYGAQKTRQWREVSSRKGQFTVRMPAKPRYRIERDEAGTRHTFTFRAARATFELTYQNNPGTLLSPEETLDIFRSVLDCLGLEPVVDEKITLAGHPGREWRMRGDGGKSLTISRVYVAGGWVYWLSVEVLAVSGAGLKDAERFFSSFELSGLAQQSSRE